MRPKWLSLIDEKKVIVVPPEKDIQETILEILGLNSNDLSRYLVIYPGRRPKRYLIRKIAERLKSSFLPPNVTSMDDFVRHLHSRIFGQRQLEGYEAIGIIYDLSVRLNLIDESLFDFSRFYPFGERIFHAIEELQIEMVPREKLVEVEGLIDLGDLSKRSFDFLSTIYREFYGRIRDLGFSTRAKMYVDLSGIDDLDGRMDFEKIIFAGFFALTEAETKILSLISRKDGFFVVFKEEGYPLDGKRDIFFYSASQIHEEVRIVGEILRRADSIEDTVIVLPRTETLFPLLRQGISFLDERVYNVSLGYPLWRTPIFSFFMTLFALIEKAEGNKVYTEDYLKFLEHPYIMSMEFKGSSEKGRELIEETWNKLRKNYPQTFLDLKNLEESLPHNLIKEIGEFEAKEDDLESHIRFIHDSFIRPFLQISNIAQFFEKCKDVLLLLYERSSARYHPLFYPYALAYFREFERISRSLLKDRSFERVSSYVNIFKRLISSFYFPFEGDPGSPLQILGFLETRNLKFKRAIILDANEGSLPELKEDYLLPNSVRKALNLPSSKERETLVGYYLNNLICGASEVHLIYLERDDVIRSRFIERLIWDIEKKGVNPLDDKLLVRRLLMEVDLSNRLPPPRDKSHEILALLESISLSPTAIDDYIECGIRFYLKYVLGMRPSDLDLFEVGTFVHLALKEFFSRKLGRILKDKSEEPLIEGIVEKIFSSRYGTTIDGRVYLLKRQVMRRLKETIDFIYGFASLESLRVHSVEEYVEGEYLGRIFSFRIDLMLEGKESLKIIDFKTSSEERRFIFGKGSLKDFEEGLIHKLPSIQIPLYILLYAKMMNLDPEKIKGYYILLGKKRLGADSIVDPFREIGIDDGLSLSKRVVEKVIGELSDPKTPFYPPKEPKSSCEFCQFKVVCGTSWIGPRREVNFSLT